jgi:uncharacterized circularly permuted ATP-grasp superfamily protein
VINQAIDRYHALIGAANLTPAAYQDYSSRFRAAKVMFGDRVSVEYLRAQFLSPEQHELVRNACRTIWSAIDKLSEVIPSRPDLVDLLGLTARERELVAVDPGYPGFSTMARFDSFLSGDTLHFVELNAESPAGPAYTEAMAEVFRKLPMMQDFEREYEVQGFNTRAKLLETLLETYALWHANTGLYGEKPLIAIVDYEGLPTVPEFELIRDYFQGQGITTIIADPRKLTYRDGRLFSGETAIDMVYRRVLMTEFIDHWNEVQPLWQAYRDGKICMVNNFRSKYLHKKMIFGLLTDGKLQEMFTQAERDAIRKHIPWTRKVQDAATDYQGKPIDLLAFLRETRDRLVLKPNDDYGGHGIFIGWECSDSEWEEAIQTALAGDYIAQEKVTVSSADFPTVREGLVYDRMNVDLDPFVWRGEVEGFLTRLSGTALCNVTSGGGIIPAFVIERRAN